MNALEDTRELVTTTSAPDTLDAADAPWRKLHVFVAGFVEDLLSQWPDVELSTIRITNLDGVITVTGRRGPLAPAECPSCHTADGHPHTDYCTAENRDYPGQPAPGSYAWAKQAARNAASEATCGFRSLDNPDLTCTYPPHPVNQIHSWQNGGDPGGWRNAIDPNKP